MADVITIQTSLDNLDDMVTSGLGAFGECSAVVTSLGTTSGVDDICSKLQSSISMLEQMEADFSQLNNILGSSEWTGPHAEEVKSVLTEMTSSIDSIQPCIQSFINWSNGYSAGFQEIDARHAFN